MSPVQPAAGPDPPSLESLLDQLEAAIGRLGDSAAPVDRLVADYQEAGRLLDAAQAHLDAAAERVAKLVSRH